MRTTPGDSREDEDPSVAPSNGKWFCVWQAGSDILISEGRTPGTSSYAEYSDDTFDTHNTSAKEWADIAMTSDVTLDHDSGAGAYRIHVNASSTTHRNGYWHANRVQWLPYSSVGSNNYVRAKFMLYRSGQADMNNYDEIPNIKLSVANRYAVSSGLQLLFNDPTNSANDSVYSDLRPSSDSGNPSVYRVDFDPVDVPYLSTFSSGLGAEGIWRRFEVWSGTDHAEDNGYILMTESSIGTYPTSALSGSAAKVYAPGVSDAGNLKIYNSSTDLSRIEYSGNPLTASNTTSISHSEGSSGITVSTVGLSASSIWQLDHNFFAGNSDGTSGHDLRVRAMENKQYKVRFHVTSTRVTSNQAGLYLKARTVRFAHSQNLEIAGGRHQNLGITREVLPGVGCLNPDKISTENGGWYTVLMDTPFSPDIRPDVAGGITCKMPNLSALPGPGVNSSSNRDVKVGFSVYDTLTPTATTGYDLEEAQFTVDRVEVSVHDRVQD